MRFRSEGFFCPKLGDPHPLIPGVVVVKAKCSLRYEGKDEYWLVEIEYEDEMMDNAPLIVEG